MKKFEVSHQDGTCIIVQSSDKKEARSFAMEKKYGRPQDNRTWTCDEWRGFGLSVREIA